MAKPVFRSVWGPQLVTLATGWVLTKPTGVVEFDLMLATFDFEGPASSVTGGSVPSGWALAATPAEIAWPHASVVYYKIAGASEPSTYTFTLGTAEAGIAKIVAYRSVDPDTPIEAASAIVAPSDTTPSFQYTSDEIETSLPDCTLFLHVGMLTAESTTWVASGMTERGDLYAGAEVTSSASYERVPVPAATVPAGTYSRTATATSNGSAQGVEVTILALKPFPSPPEIPANTEAPAVTGDPTVTFTLACAAGEWTGDPTPDLSYQWQADAAGNGVFADIVGATSSTYELQATEEGDRVRCVVTGTNGSGAVAANSDAVGPSEPAPEPADSFMVGELGDLVATASRMMTPSGQLVPPP